MFEDSNFDMAQSQSSNSQQSTGLKSIQKKLNQLSERQKKGLKVATICTVISVIALIFIVLVFPTNSIWDAFFPKPASDAFTNNTSLALPTSVSAVVNTTVNVPVMLNTNGNNVIGVDVIINFDTTKLELQTITAHYENSTLDTYLPINGSNEFNASQVVQNANASGVIEFSALAFDIGEGAPNSAFNGLLDSNSPLATLQFLAKATGSSNMTFSHTPGSTTDSNIVPQGAASDILQMVQNASVTVTALPTNTPVPTNTPIPPTNTPIPPTSTPTPTGGITPTTTPPTATPTLTPTTAPTVQPSATPSPTTVPTVAPSPTPTSAPPQPPTVNTLTSPTYATSVTLSGTKPANTSVWINNQQAVSLNSSTSWSVVRPIAKGNNSFSVVVRNSSGVSSTVVNRSVVVHGLADVNGNNVVDVFDLGIMAGNYGLTGINSASPNSVRMSDITGDTKVNVFDLGILAGNYGKTY